MAAPPNLVGSISPGWGLAVLSGTFLAYLLLRGIYYAFFHPLSKIAGPKLYAASDIPYLYHIVRGNWPQKLKELHDRYGPVVRTTNNDVSFTTPGAWKTIYGHRAAGQETFQKDRKGYRPTVSGHPNIIIANDADHRRQRRLLTHAFSDKALRGQEDIMKRYVDLLIAKLHERARTATPVVDIVKWYNFTTFDLIGDLAFGQPFGCLESGGYHPWVAMIFESIKLGSLSTVILRHPWLKPLARLFISRKLVRNQDNHRELTTQTAKRRLESGNLTREDFISYILRYNDEKGMSEWEIIENSSILIIAGSETTATQLSGTTFWLLTRGNEDKYRRLVDEIRGRFEREEDITLISVQGLEYMNACFEESFRMYPPVPIALPRLTPDKGEVIEGYYIPRKVGVGVPQWASYQTERNFKNHDKFVPERWLGDPEYENDVRAILQPFSTGPRNCIGRNLAYAEMRLILARLFWNFDLEMMPDSQNWNKQKIYTLWEKGAINVKLKPVRRE
ncbi:cytochrome P450 [Cladorrhinum samala]|uniref:Cytochrome P450 n=1 Tax=Cladorrhinum samala TaxID=585594 RepID=A0AAV9HL68_9PEZI|nr:cytochrome P450 [Cladorrhinum samala]